MTISPSGVILWSRHVGLSNGECPYADPKLYCQSLIRTTSNQSVEPARPTAHDFTRIQDLVIRMAERLNNNNSDTPDPTNHARRTSNDQNVRHTPASSAFGGHSFIPQGLAAKPVFTPYRDPPNPHHVQPIPNTIAAARGRMNFPDPPKFTGKQEEFHNWIRHLSSKLNEDAECFKREESRVMYAMTSLTGDAERSLSPRYDLGNYPFSCLAEMIQVLETTYHDHKSQSIVYRPAGDTETHVQTRRRYSPVYLQIQRSRVSS